MLYSPKSIANFLIDIAQSRGESISPMKLQKLVYYAHGWYAGYTGTPLIDEAVEAWQYGPVIPSLYHEFKRFGSGPISSKATEFKGLGASATEFKGFELVEVDPPKDPALQQFLKNVYASYGQYTGLKLSEMTHAAGSPWDETWRANQGVRGADIPFEKIADHFKAAVTKSQAATPG